jgi:carbon-monoxide dehydrogenase small subunit
MAMTAAAFLEENPHPDREEIQEGVKGNICRCTGYTKIYDSILDAADRLEDTSIESAQAESND